MILLQPLTITTALTAYLGPVYTPPKFQSVTLECIFSYGSGGTSMNCWVQTSLDDTEWQDVVNFEATTESLITFYNLSTLTPKTTAVAHSDGSLSANTSTDGILCGFWRTKITTVGTYAGGTILQINALFR